MGEGKPRDGRPRPLIGTIKPPEVNCGDGRGPLFPVRTEILIQTNLRNPEWFTRRREGREGARVSERLRVSVWPRLGSFSRYPRIERTDRKVGTRGPAGPG
jgi:hypothetical protein